MSRKIEVQILGDSKSLEAALGRAQAKTSKLGSALAAGAKIGAAGLLGLGVAAKIGFDELVDSQRVMKQTQAVIKSTGGEANVTAEHVDTLSQSLLQLSGVDDETIASGENMLLTFRNIHNEVGKGNDIFDQATKATLDLSVAMGKDMQSSAILVGKALNDPVKGMTSLRRVGVSLSTQQEALVKHLVKTGDTMAAQKIILGELTKEFGGSAAAAGTTLPAQLSKLREGFADVAAQLVSALLPSLNSLIGVLSSATGWMKQNQEATKLIVIAIASLSAGVIVVNAVYKTWAAVTRVATAAQWLLNAAMDANPVVLITAGIIALGVALVIAYKKSETFRNVVGGVIDFVRDHWKLLLALIPGIGPVLVVVATHFKTLRNAAGSALDFVADKVQTVINVVKQLWSWILTAAGALQSLADKAKSVLSVSGIDVVKGIVSGAHAAPFVPSRGGGAAGAPSVINLHLDGKVFYSAMVNQDKVSRRQSGRSLLA